MSPAGAATVVDSLLRESRRLVAEGRGLAGRALLDSVISRIPEQAPQYADALYFRATMAVSSDAAERDYRRITVEFSFSARAEDALLRLSQLELLRGNRAQAVSNLERLLRDYPGSSSRARANFWLARAELDGGDARKGCMALDAAWAIAPLSDAELRNQIRYYLLQCVTLPRAAEVQETPKVIPPEAMRMFSVQVAAFDTKAGAEQLRAKLATQKFDAYVAVAGKIFRVRIGHVSTRAQAESLAKTLHSKGLAGFIVVSEVP